MKAPREHSCQVQTLNEEPEVPKETDTTTPTMEVPLPTGSGNIEPFPTP